ncbi:MAG: hypothetical protein EBR32_05435 [Bacteroidetes bacterium]|nr:hypothetical protein [Bacteroidota bacterium]
MRDFEWQYLEDINNDNTNCPDNYFERMIDNYDYDEDYDQADQELESWSNYYEEISEEIEY